LTGPERERLRLSETLARPVAGHLLGSFAIRAALDEIGASPKSFTYGDARLYATSELVDALRERFLMAVGVALPHADMNQVNDFLADTKCTEVTRWVLLGKAGGGQLGAFRNEDQTF
jgi:hypothetical protein